MVAAALGTVMVASPQGQESDTPEVRALWVTRASLTSPDSISSLVRSARAAGFNTLLVQVRGRGDAYYNEALEPRPDGLVRQPRDFDPLQSVITRAGRTGC